jgi:glycosyltransferase involved in cell wall biosynthesis
MNPFPSNVSNTVSVIIPFFNAEKTISRCVHSVLSQTSPAHQIIAIDDGSTDASAKVIQRYSDRVHLISQSNCGVAAARNCGIEQARGNWIAFLDADDCWTPDKLECQLPLLTEPNDLVYADAIICENNTRRKYSDLCEMPSGFVAEELILRNFITTSTVVVRRKSLDEVGRFPQNLPAIVDWPVWLAIAKHGRVAYVNKTLVEYHVSESSITRNVSKTLPAHLMVVEGFFSKLERSVRNGRLRRRALSHAYSVVGGEAGRSGQYAFSSRCYFKAIGYWPLEPTNFRYLAKSVLAACKLRNW